MPIAETNKGPIEYRLYGEGPTIVVLYGGHCSRNTHLSHERLANFGFTVLVPSRPGYDKTPSYVGRSAQEAADAINALLDTLKIDTVDMIGISAAGPTALAYAIKYKNRLNKLILESAVSLPWDKKLKRQSRFIFGKNERMTWYFIKSLLKLMPKVVIKMMMKKLTALDVRDVMGRLVDDDIFFIKSMIESFQSGEGFINDIEHKIDNLSSIINPVLVMYSPNDGSVSPENSKHIIHEIKNCEVLEVPADTHLIWIGSYSNEVWNKRLAFLKNERISAT